MYRSILVAIDLDEPSSWAETLPVAVSLARCFSAGLTLCSVVTDRQAELRAQWSPIGFRQMVENARIRLLSIASGAGGLPVEVEIGFGTVCSGVIAAAEKVGADLILLASHRPGVKDYLLAAQAARIARRATCSVFVVRSGGEAKTEQLAERVEAAEPG